MLRHVVLSSAINARREAQRRLPDDCAEQRGSRREERPATEAELVLGNYVSLAVSDTGSRMAFEMQPTVRYARRTGLLHREGGQRRARAENP